MSKLANLKKDIAQLSNPSKAQALQKYFKTGKGEYGEGDKFVGLTVPETRAIAKKYYRDLTLLELKTLLASKIHEHRFAALEVLVMKFEKASAKEQKQIYNLYLANTKYINNWDLVDTSAEYIVGAYLQNQSKKVIEKLAQSKSIWERRIAIISTFHFIKQGSFDDALKIAETLIYDKEDLIHKAVGWMLREVGNRNLKLETKFLNKFAIIMPRTMLRYAIEKFPETERQKYLKLKPAKPKTKDIVDVSKSSEVSDQVIKLVVKVIQKSLPKTKQEIKFGIPFYWPFCYLSLKRKSLIIGIGYGAMLTDPLKRLQGNQKSIRHYIVKNLADIQPEYLAMLLEESWELYEQGIRPFGQNKTL